MQPQEPLQINQEILVSGRAPYHAGKVGYFQGWMGDECIISFLSTDDSDVAFCILARELYALAACHAIKVSDDSDVSERQYQENPLR
jgi:hypothetical protein